MSSQNKTIIFVLSMHRSGSSALTRIINLLGAGIDKNLLEPGLCNPKGFWEPMDFMLLNEDLLAALSASWDDPWVIGLCETHLEKLLREFQDRAMAHLSQLIDQDSVSVIKDPRVCVLLPFWLSIAQSLGCEIKFVWMVRNPCEVAASLETRDQFDDTKSGLLWLAHNLEVSHYTKGLQGVVCTYHGLMRDWRCEAEKIINQLSLDGLLSLAKAEEIDAFITVDLKHHAAASDDIKNLPSGDLLYQVYEKLLAANNDKHAEVNLSLERQKILETTTMIRPYVKSLAEVFDQKINAMNDQLVSEKQKHQGEINNKNAETEQLLKRIHELEQEVSLMQQSISWRITEPLRKLRKISA